MTIPGTGDISNDKIVHTSLGVISGVVLALSAWTATIFYDAGQNTRQIQVNTSVLTQHAEDIKEMQHSGTDYTRGIIDEMRNEMDRLQKRMDDIEGKIK